MLHIEGAAELISGLERKLLQAEMERDARPNITPEDAAEAFLWINVGPEPIFPKDWWVRFRDAIAAHRKKAGDGNA